LFFVLSGYLITSILFGIRESDEYGTESGHGQALRHFFIRRVLRIFPVYYFALLLLALLNQVQRWPVAVPHAAWPWLGVFGGNWYRATVDPNLGAATPYWSVAVEEQFYLIWPWLMLLPPRRLLLPTLMAVLAGTLIVKVLAAIQNWPYFFVEDWILGATDFL